MIDDSAAATQPLSRSARVADAATQPLCHIGWSSHAATQPAATQTLCRSGWSSPSATLLEWLEQPPRSHSATLATTVAGAATQPLCHMCRGAATQPLSHSARVWSSHSDTQPLRHSAEQPLSHSPLSHSAMSSHSATQLEQPLSHSEWLSSWVASSQRTSLSALSITHFTQIQQDPKRRSIKNSSMTCPKTRWASTIY